MAKGVITMGKDRDWARQYLCAEVVKRYKKLFEEHQDDIAVETLQKVRYKVKYLLCIFSF